MVEVPIKNSTEFIGYGEDITRISYFTQELKIILHYRKTY